LRRARRSSLDKTSTRIANYWDRTALACCRHSKRVELSRKIRLDSARCMRRMRVVCCAAGKMTAGPHLCCYRPIAMLRLFCYVFAHEFLFDPHFDLELNYIIRKGIQQEFNDVICVWKYCQLFTHESLQCFDAVGWASGRASGL